MRAEFIAKTAEYVKNSLEGEGSGHDWWHIYRVWKNAQSLSEGEAVDTLVVELAALLHDIADHKFHQGDLTIGPAVARRWLEGLGVEEDTISHVAEIIRDISFKGAGVETPMRTTEGKIVQDADRLDAIGAVGIARVFAYGGYKRRAMHIPGVSPSFHTNFQDYRNDEGTSVNHFYEKLLLLKDRMNTQKAQALAMERHKFMEVFLERFFQEWEGFA